MRMDDEVACPVLGLEKYIQGAATTGVNLKCGYVFRLLYHSNRQVLDVHVSSSLMYSRLKSDLRHLDLDEGETTHSIRGGCAVTLAVSGYGNTQEIMKHVGWFSQDSLDRYSRLGRMTRTGAIGNLLENVVETPDKANTILSALG